MKNCRASAACAGAAMEAVYARDLTPLLAEIAHHFAQAAPGGEAAHYLALAATAAGHTAGARDHFETALAMNERMGARPWLARTHTAYAALLIDGRRQADRQRARELLLQSLEVADDLGLAPTSERTVALLHRLGPAPAPSDTPASPDGLTTRELEVLRLLAAGRTNAEIADDLVVSVHTVIRHIANIYDKIGVHRRSEATAYALRRGIAPPAGD